MDRLILNTMLLVLRFSGTSANGEKNNNIDSSKWSAAGVSHALSALRMGQFLYPLSHRVTAID